MQGWLDQGIDCYAYFNNDTLENGRAPAIDNARRLREMVELDPASAQHS